MGFRKDNVIDTERMNEIQLAVVLHRPSVARTKAEKEFEKAIRKEIKEHHGSVGFINDLPESECDNPEYFVKNFGTMFQPTLSQSPRRVLKFFLRETVKTLIKTDLRNAPEKKAGKQYHHSRKTQDELCNTSNERYGEKRAAKLGKN